MKHDGLNRNSVAWARMAEAGQDKCLDICQEFLDELEVTAPVDSGRLASSFRAVQTHRGAKVVNTDAAYWFFVEYGHKAANQHGTTDKDVPAHPFARPAWEVVRARHA